MFFGTPHRGSAVATWALMLNAIGCFAFMRLSDKYIKTLKLDSEELAQISESFLSIASRFKIVSFYEELRHPSVNRVVSYFCHVCVLRTDDPR
jgi:hypothetical protein